MTGSLPRPALFALIGAVAVAGLFMFTRRSADSGGSPAPAASETAAPAPAGAQAPPAGSQAGAGSSSATGGGASSATDTDSPAASEAGSSQPGPSAKPQGSGGESGALPLPTKVQRALDDKRVVVLLLWNPKAVDDRSVKGSVDRLSSRGGKVAVFTDHVRNLARYTRITAAAQVTQTPSVVLVSRRGEAEVQAGYLDFQTINQYVSNALGR